MGIEILWIGFERDERARVPLADRFFYRKRGLHLAVFERHVVQIAVSSDKHLKPFR